MLSSRTGRPVTSLAIVTAALLAATACAPADVDGPGTGGQATGSPEPSSAVASAAPIAPIAPVRRTVTLGGADLRFRWIWYLGDADHAWALFESKAQPTVSALGVTADGGITWRPARMPNTTATINVYPLDARTLSIHEIGRRFWLTTDGGTRFTAYPETAPPPQALLASMRPYTNGPFALLCPGAHGFEDGANGISCERELLVRIGTGPVSPQPTLAGELTQVLSGADGRLWLTAIEAGRTRVAVSTDNAGSWTELSPVPDQIDLSLSRDGRDVWAVADFPSALWKLTGDRFVARQGLPAGVATHNVVAVGGGELAVSSERGDSGFWRDGTFTPVFGSTTTVEVVPDGTVVFASGPGQFLVGRPTSAGRSWLRLS